MSVEKGFYGSENYNNRNTALWNTNSLNVVRASTVVLGNPIVSLNFIGGFPVVIDLTQATADSNFFIFNTGATGPASLSAILSGSPLLIGGASSISIPQTGGSDPVCLYWDGTTLSLNS